MQKVDLSILKQALSTLDNAFSALKNNQDMSIEEFLEDSCVKRFEYTLEISWKTMKRVLKDIYGKTDQAELTINNIFRLMEGYGIISSWESWRDYYQMRTDSAHEYNFEKSNRIIGELPQFIKDTRELCDNLAHKITA